MSNTENNSEELQGRVDRGKALRIRINSWTVTLSVTREVAQEDSA